ncbi:MAG: hypothetical protein JXB14_05520 [Candidatus Altiarchaeota archaeon]|nr:hypothetical protein [Candidatus Altiarchaeota archaeon]
MATSKPEELVAKLYEEGMSDKQVKKQLEDFGLSGKEAHDLMKRARELQEERKKEVKESKDGEKFIGGMKDRAKSLPKDEKKEEPKDEKSKSSFLSGLFRSKPKGENRIKEEEITSVEWETQKKEEPEDKKSYRHHREKPKDEETAPVVGLDERKQKLEKMKFAISSGLDEEEAPEEVQEAKEGQESKEEPMEEPKPKEEPKEDLRKEEDEDKELIEIVKREVQGSKNKKPGVVSQSKMEGNDIDQLNEKLDEMQKEIGELKEVLNVIRDLNIKLVELVKVKQK